MTNTVYIMLEIEYGTKTIHGVYEDGEYAQTLADNYSKQDNITRVVYPYKIIREPAVTREDVIYAATKAIAKLPEHQLAGLKRTFELAEKEAQWIVNRPGSKQ